MTATLLALLAAGATPATAPVASQAASGQAGSFIGELVSIVLPLAFIILVLLAILRLAKRRYGMTGQDAPMSVVQILPLGPRERIVLVKTRTGRVFAVGVSSQSVNLVTDLDPADLVVPGTPPDAPDGGAGGHKAGSKVFGWPLNRRDPGPGPAGRPAATR